jgi:aspartate racemase
MTISLTDVVLDAVVFSQKPALLLATEGTRRMRVFEANEHWREAAPFIVLPDDADQRTIHHCIYNELKTNSAPGNVVEFLRRLCDKYAVTQLIAGCTELHRVSRYLLSPVSSSMPAQIIDPLLIIAQNYKEFVHEQIQPYGRLCRQLHPLCQ